MNVAFVESGPLLLLIAPPSSDAARPAASVPEAVVMLEQFFTPTDPSSISWVSERRLLLTVLEDAVVM